VESGGRENATFVTLARNEELGDLVETIKIYEARFNSRFHYDWVMLNNEPFTEEFIQTVKSLISGKVMFGQVPSEQWQFPAWINQDEARASWQRMVEDDVVYADLESYHHMCRYESGFFYEHPLMQQYRYYWRVEPATKLLCDVDYDVFKFMRENNKTYGFTIALHEWERTVPTLWNSTLQFVAQHPEYVHHNNLLDFVYDPVKNGYNLCHFWSNFEIADMEFWRGQAYQEYFNYLDQCGGFYYERWGDAPIHSLAVSLFVDKSKLHYFDDIGYSHFPNEHCPAQQAARGLKCDCKINERSFDWLEASCLDVYYDAINVPYMKTFWE
jgi:alpha 1,2-mannosyltransferase